MYTALKPLVHEIVTMAKIIAFDFFPFISSFYGRAPLLKQIKKKIIFWVKPRGTYFYQKLKFFHDALKKFSEIFNHKNWIYLVIFLNLWGFGFSKLKTFPKMGQISKLFRDDYHWINRNIHPCKDKENFVKNNFLSQNN